MRPIPFSSEPLIRWPDGFWSTKFHGGYVLALLVAFVLALVIRSALS